MRRHVTVHRAMSVPYEPALAWQRAASEGVRSGARGEALAILQHQPVYTVGARGGRRHLLADPLELEARGARVLDVDRGGDVTFHGPGQLVAYPILDLRPDARAMRAGDYVRALEQVVIETVAACGVRGERVAGRPGVWAGSPPAKLAALGVRIERGVSRHGLALNVSTNLEWFEAIVPCGIADAEVTSLERLLGGAPPFEAVVDAFLDAFAHVFDSDLVEGAALLEEATAMAETEVAGAS
jgi:lipoyl(octanoyl) transferase